MTVNETITNFLNHCEYGKNISKKTIKAYNSDLKQFNNYINTKGINNIHNIDKDLMKEYIYSISPALKPKSVKRKIATLKCFFNYLEFEDIIQVNLFRKLHLKIKVPQKLPIFLTINEITSMLKMMYELKEKVNNITKFHNQTTIRDIAIIECLFATGIRVSELCSLKIENIDSKYETIKIKGKGDKERILFLNEKVVKIFHEYQNLFYLEIQNCGYFFINRLKKQISDQSVRNIVKKYTKLAKIEKKVTPHIFRHSFASLLLNEGVDLRYIQEFLGHSSITTTQIYSHTNISKQKQILKEKHPRNLIDIY